MQRQIRVAAADKFKGTALERSIKDDEEVGEVAGMTEIGEDVPEAIKEHGT